MRTRRIPRSLPLWLLALLGGVVVVEGTTKSTSSSIRLLNNEHYYPAEKRVLLPCSSALISSHMKKKKRRRETFLFRGGSSSSGSSESQSTDDDSSSQERKNEPQGGLRESEQQQQPKTRLFGNIWNSSAKLVRRTTKSEEESEDSSSGEPPVKLAEAEVADSNITIIETTAAPESDVVLAATPDSPTTHSVGVVEEEQVATKNTKDDEESSIHEITDDAAEKRKTASAALRLKGKELHDAGDYEAAAVQFAAAADALIISETEESTEEYATCRLHEALCHLKCQQYEQAEIACNSVLELDENSTARTVPAALRARAHHRRAKAALGLGQPTAAAIPDARAAAFLGDRKAVALYGRLMREQQQQTTSDDASTDMSGALLESLLKKSGSSSSSSGGSSPFGMTGSPGNAFSPLSWLMNSGSNGSGGGLAKSVLASLSKRISDENTQESIARYLKNTSGPQIQQYAAMAGVQLEAQQANRIAGYCHAVDQKMLRRTVSATKRTVYVVQIIRKTFQVIAKYRNILIAWLLLVWIKSSILRPVPVRKQKTARLAAAVPATANKPAAVVAGPVLLRDRQRRIMGGDAI